MENVFRSNHGTAMTATGPHNGSRPGAGEASNVAIVGGGLVALCSAFYLERSGAMVTVFDRDAVGSGASRGNGGQIVPADPLPAPGMVREGLKHWFSPSSAFYIHPRSVLKLSRFLTGFALHANERAYLSAFRKLDQLNRPRVSLFDELAEAGIGTHFQPTGNLRAYQSRETALTDWQAARRLAALGLVAEPGEFLDGDGLHALEPSLGAAARWGFLRPDVRFGDPSMFVDQLRGYLTGRGVTLIEGEPVSDITEHGNGVTLVTESGRAEFDQVLIAAGVASAELVRRAGGRINLVPGKGYSFTVRPEVMPGYTLLLGEAHVGATPLDDARLRIAGTMELGAHDALVTGSRIRGIATAARPFIEGIDWSSITEEWAGLRPMTPDGLPYIGRVGGRMRVFVATGHNMLGLSLAPATGHEMAALMTGAIEDDILAPFALAR